MDIAALFHVYYDHVMFKIYTSVKDSKMILGDARTTNVVGNGDF